MAENISKEEVVHVAKLARIEITPEEETKFTEELSGVLKYIDQLQDINTDNVAPTYHPASPKGHDAIENITREDRVVPCEKRERLLNSAPAREGDFVKVKSVFK